MTKTHTVHPAKNDNVTVFFPNFLRQVEIVLLLELCYGLNPIFNSNTTSSQKVTPDISSEGSGADRQNFTGRDRRGE